MVNEFDVFYFPGVGSNFKQWASNEIRRLFPTFSSNLCIQDDVVFQRHLTLDKLYDNKLLIIGGGPSTLTLTKEFINLFDSVWSINHFFNSPLLYTTNLDLVCLGAGVDLDYMLLEEYLKTFNTTVAFEIHPKWESDSNKKFINGKFHKSDKKLAFHTKFYSKLGGCVRLINLAAACHPKEIHFVGLDGPKALIAGEHAFEKGKKSFPALVNENNVYSIFKRQYDEFWTYIRKLYPHVKFISLDPENEMHFKANS
jgi:hypothetical protein